VVDAGTLFELNIALEYKGTPRQIFDQFADRLKLRHARLSQQGASLGKVAKTSQVQRHSQRLERFVKAINQLRHPKPTLERAFLSKVDAVESIRQMQARAHDAAAAALSGAGAAAQQLAPPPGPPVPQAPLLAIAPPPATLLTTDEEIFSHLDELISLTPDCAKCEVARTDPAARLAFTEQGGKGATRDVSLKSACPLFEHGVSKNRLRELLDDVTSLGKVAKRQKVDQYMLDKRGATPLGKPDGAVPYNVSLYHLSQTGRYTPVDATGALSTGATPPRHKEFYQGFQV
jgi:hypothetical protein